MKRIGFNLFNLGIYLYVVNYVSTTFFITPAFAIDYINGTNIYIDLEIRFLCIGFGIHLMIRKDYYFKYPFWKLFKKPQ